MMVEVTAGYTTVLGPAHEDTMDAVEAVARWEREMASALSAKRAARWREVTLKLA